MRADIASLFAATITATTSEMLTIFGSMPRRSSGLFRARDVGRTTLQPLDPGHHRLSEESQAEPENQANDPRHPAGTAEGDH